MSKVPVLDTNKQRLAPCHPAIARRLLREGKAAVLKRYPFTIILKKSVEKPVTSHLNLSIDPGSKCTGLAITDADNNIVAAFELHHRTNIKKSLSDRAGYRRSRRTRKYRHRPARWANRSRKSPSLTETGWKYKKVPNTRKAENTFNRVSHAQLRDSRYEWIRIQNRKRKESEKTREKTRLYFANGKRIRRGQLYYEKDGSLYPYNSNNPNHKQYKACVYTPKGPKPKMRWRRAPVKDTAPRDNNGHRLHNGWIAPSLMSRIFNIDTWVKRLMRIYPITHLAVEHVKFDMQKMENPEISGVEYQQGTLMGYEIREYLLEKFNRKCFYCGKKNIPLDIEHIHPKGRGGTSRIDNLTIACRPCNSAKGNKLSHELGADMQAKVQRTLKAAKKTLKDAAAVNTIRWKIAETLEATGLPLEYGTGGKTKYHRTQAGLPKTHYFDAASVSCIPKAPDYLFVLCIHAVGYGHRQNLGAYQTKQKAPGFKSPYTRTEHASGFQKLDIVEMRKKNGKKIIGSVNTFDKTEPGKPQKLRIKRSFDRDDRPPGNVIELQKLQKRDGYAYPVAFMKGV